MSTGFSSEFIEERKKQLEARRVQLMAELTTVADRDPRAHQVAFNAEFPNFGDSLEDNALEVAGYEENLLLEEDLEKSLESTKRAIEKIKTGAYGTCEQCGKLIEPKRLEAFPSATACMSCKRKSGSKTSLLT